MPPKDASPGRLSRQEPGELTDTFPNKVPLSRGTMTGEREGTAAEKRAARKRVVPGDRRQSGAEGPPGPGNLTLGKTVRAERLGEQLKEVALKATPRSCHFLLNLAYELKVAAPGVSASRASHFLLL